MIFVLACFDLAVVVVFHPMTTVQVILCWQYRKLDKFLYVQHLFVFSLTALLTMTGERCLALVYPFLHQKFVTKSRLMATFVLLQLPFGLVHTLRVDNLEAYIEVAIVVVLIGTILIVLLGLNYKISYIAKNIENRTITALGSLNQTEVNVSAANKSRVTVKRVSTCLLAVTCLLVCYSPAVAYFAIVLTDVPENWTDQTLCVTYLWIRTFITLNSSLNCLIFFYKNSALRREGRLMLKKYFPGRH
jgi:hypothetical protein